MSTVHSRISHVELVCLQDSRLGNEWRCLKDNYAHKNERQLTALEILQCFDSERYLNAYTLMIGPSFQNLLSGRSPLS